MRQFVGKTTGHDVHSFIMMRLNYGDAAHRPTKSRAGSKQEAAAEANAREASPRRAK